MTHLRCLFVRALCATFAATLPAAAQSTARPADAKGETVELSAFVVSNSKDIGYKASNSISGTRTNTPILDLPINLQVITPEFMRDVNANYATDALSYAGSVAPGNTSRGEMAIRGFRARWNLRNGFRAEGQAPAVNTERVEVIKGPASVIYGITPPGGTFNIITKSPRFGGNFYQFDAQAGWTGGNMSDRVTGDINVGSLGGKIAFRLAAQYANLAEYRDWSDEGRENTLAPSVEWRPFRSTSVKFQYERHRRKQFSGGQHLTQNDAATGAAVPIQVLFPAIPWEWNWLGPDSLQERRERTSELTLTQRIGDHWEIQAVYSRAGDYISNNDTQQQFTTNAGQPAVRLQKIDSLGNNTLKNYVVASVYRLNLERTPVGPVQNTLLATYQYNQEVSTSRTRRINGANGAVLSVFAPVQAGIDIRGLFAGRNYDWVSPTPAHGERNYDAMTATWIGRFAQEKLILNAGAAYIDIRRLTGGVKDYDADTTKPFIGIVFRPRPWLSLFALRSESTFPDPRRDGFDNPIDPVTGRGLEAGIKLETADGRLSGTISAFDIENVGEPVFDNFAPNKFTATNPANLGAWVPAGKSVTKGFDVDLVLTPRPDWQLLLSYNYHNAYIAENRVRPDLVGQDATFGDFDHKIAGWTKYTLRDGPAKGLAVAGGLRWQNRANADFFRGQARNRKPGVAGDLALSYAFRWGGRDLRLMFNANNLLNNDSFVGFKPVPAGQIATEPYRFKQGRAYYLSSSISF